MGNYCKNGQFFPYVRTLARQVILDLATLVVDVVAYYCCCSSDELLNTLEARIDFPAPFLRSDYILPLFHRNYGGTEKKLVNRFLLNMYVLRDTNNITAKSMHLSIFENQVGRLSIQKHYLMVSPCFQEKE